MATRLEPRFVQQSLDFNLPTVYLPMGYGATGMQPAGAAPSNLPPRSLCPPPTASRVAAFLLHLPRVLALVVVAPVPIRGCPGVVPRAAACLFPAAGQGVIQQGPKLLSMMMRSEKLISPSSVTSLDKQFSVRSSPQQLNS